MTTIQSVVSRSESVFDKIVLPGLSLAGGWFGGPTLFTLLEERISQIDSNGDGVSDFDAAFGGDAEGNYVGSRIVAGMLVGVAGFGILKMGGFIKFLGLFLVGAAFGMLASGFRLV